MPSAKSHSIQRILEKFMDKLLDVPLLERRICEFGFFFDFEGKIRFSFCHCLTWIRVSMCGKVFRASSAETKNFVE